MPATRPLQVFSTTWRLLLVPDVRFRCPCPAEKGGLEGGGSASVKYQEEATPCSGRKNQDFDPRIGSRGNEDRPLSTSVAHPSVV